MMKTKKSLLHSGIALLVCISMFIGSTFAWFSDSITSKKNIITAGNLDLEMYWTDDLDSGKWYNVEKDGHNTIFNYNNWEPGYTNVKYIKLVNAGKLALNYKLSLTPEDGVGKLAEVINVYYAEGGVDVKQRSDLQNLKAIGLLHNVLNGGATADGTLLAADQYSPLHPSGEVIMTVALNMLTTAGNEYQNEDSGKFTITALATQAPFEEDSFGKDYDANAEYPTMLKGDSAVAPVTPVNGKVPAGGVTLSGSNISAFVPEGTEMEAGADKLTLKVTPLEKTTSDIIVVNNEILIPVDVHIDGVAESNTVPIIVNLGEILPKYLNMGNYHLYHVEDGANSVMTLVADASALTTHNTFTYDPLTGAVSVAMASFSEVALVADKAATWEGKRDYTWYNENATELTIANADQFAGLSAIVGGMDNQTQDSFSGKTLKLLSDINLNHGTVLPDEENTTTIIFYPVGYYNSEGTYDRTGTKIASGFHTFEGTFDGAGHIISNIYQNTWEMKGDHDWYEPEDQYYRDGMGLFGKVYGGTIKNLTVDNFKSDGEITTTGVISSYADFGATFENIAITNCNPRVYNIGNGGIVGCVGWYTKEKTDKVVTFKNITIDNSNMISALWGSYDVACGGIVGQYYPTSGQTFAGTPKNPGIHFENCHVSAIMDVYNDVCANYQYYAYRYAGMIIGSIRENETIDGHVYPKMEGITASGCTVHYDTWNDYFYCELVANSLASYTHDHQFSRLERVESVDVENMQVTTLKKDVVEIPTSGHYNYVVVDGEFATENATCYHFVDGKVWNHADAGTETVNGVAGVLKEDKQHIYLPFAQLFTGYGWGVTSKGIEDFEGIDTIDITHSGHKESVFKFNAKENIEWSRIARYSTISVGDLFEEIKDAGVEIKNDRVMVAVTDITNTGITADFTRGETWDKGTLEFNSSGGWVRITIQDYYFCKPTSVDIQVGDFEKVDRFEVKFPNVDKYLYRVGNLNTINLGSLFGLKEGVDKAELGEINVVVTDMSGTKLDIYTAGTGEWNSGTIKFANEYTGPAHITISDNNNSAPVTLNVEVVDAENATSASGATNKNIVLLKDVTFNSSYLYYKNMTLYGNGFTIDITGADHSDLKNSSDTSSNKSAYCNIWMTDSVFNNVKIVGSVYSEVGMTADSDYGNAAIRTEGECYIVESYISNNRVPLRVQGNTTLVDTVVDGGRYANIELRFGKLTLDGVTTINTARKGIDGTTDVIGFGIVIHDEATNASISVIGDGLKQYNWVGANKHKPILSGDTYLSQAYGLIFNSNNSDAIYFSQDGDRYVNTGVLCLSASLKSDVVTGLNDRYTQNISGRDAWVMTYQNSEHTGWFNESYATESVTYNPEQYPVIPNYSGNKAQTVEFTKGETYKFDTSVLTAEKNGQMLSVSNITMNGTKYNYGDKIPLNEGGVYDIVYTVVDPYNYNSDASATNTATHNISITVTAIAKDATILSPKFTFIDQNGNQYNSTTVKAGDKTYVMPNVTAADQTTNAMSNINIGSASISGTTVYFPIAEGYTKRSGSNFNRYYPLFNGINITDYTVAGDTTGTTYTTSGNYTSVVGSDINSKFVIPANSSQASCGDYVKTSGQSGNAAGNSDSGWQGAGYSTSYDGTYLKSGNTNASSGADKNGYERIVWVEYCFNAGNGDVYYYRIGYHCNKEAANSGGCVTGDTLVTLVDGSKKRIDSLDGSEQLIVWDFYKGEYTVSPVGAIVNHGYDVVNEVTMRFADGTTIKTLRGHGFFDVLENKFVIIDEYNIADYVGHEFFKYDGNGNNLKVTLVDYSVESKYNEIWTIVSAFHFDCILNDFLTLSPTDYENSPAYLMPFEIGTDMKYDEAKMIEDIEKYGLYTYEDFEEYCTYEQFVGLAFANWKVAVGKGYIKFEDIVYLISNYVK